MRINKLSSLLIKPLIFSLLFISTLSFAQTEEKAHETKKFDPGKTIIGHITDAHEWHIIELGEKPVAIPLPIIIYSTDKGLSIFSSSRFEHGEVAYEGYKLQGNKIVAVNEAGQIDDAATANIWDFSLTKNVMTIFLSVFIMLLVFISVANTYKRAPNAAPNGLQSFVEPIIIFVRDDVAKPSIGKNYKKFMPYLLTIFFFIWITNLLGLIPIFPGGANVTGNTAVTITLGVMTFIITMVIANKNYWKHIFAMPGVPKAVLIILTPIEIIGVFLKPIVLIIRLFANILAGHIIALSFFSLIFIFGEMNTGLGLGVSIVSVAFTVFMMFLELLVAFLQAYVFTLLSAIYFGGAMEEHHHEHEHNEEIREGMHHFVSPDQNQHAVI